MELLQNAGVPFLVGGAYAFGHYTGILRDTKDLDLFLRPSEVERATDTLGSAGHETESTAPHWLAKVKCGEYVIDLIYGAGNGLCQVDDSWFARARNGKLLDLPVELCAPEEIIWMKAFVMERERYDGADVAHLMESCAEKLDWEHLLQRFGPDWRVLLSHLVLFGYVYPGERHRIPKLVRDRLRNRFRRERPADGERICRGTLLSRQQYLIDVQERGFRDARLEERVNMDDADIELWTEAIACDGSPEQ